MKFRCLAGISQGMTKLRNIFVMIVSIVGLLAGGWIGYELAGILGAILFIPVGAWIGALVGSAPFNLVNFLR